jgi:hypothetical protein
VTNPSYKLLPGHSVARRLGDFVVLGRFSFEVDDPDVPFLLVLKVDSSGPVAKCTELRCTERPGGDGITTDGLRKARLATYLRAGCNIFVANHGGEEDGYINADLPVSDEEFQTYLRQRRREERQGRRRITDGDLRRLADTYRQALALGLAPTAEVERVLRLRSRAQAARWVSKAREAGFLRAAPGPRQAGEIS